MTGVLVLTGLTACVGGSGGSQEEREELAAFVQQMASYNGAEVTPEDVDFYMTHITDSFVQDFGGADVAECRADPEFCIGEPLPNASVDANNVVIEGDTATAVIDSDIGAFGIELIKEDDVWKANGSYVPDDEIPAGTEIIEVELIEFAFVGDLTSETVQSGDFAFRFVNNGQQTHEAVLVELPAEGTLDELLSDESFQPEPIFVKFAYGPGEESDVALPETLAAGRYGLICFLPDTTEGPEGTPHAFKGMVAEFMVG
jgi:hypothetical protein